MGSKFFPRSIFSLLASKITHVPEFEILTRFRFVGEDRNKNTAEWRLAVTARQRVAEGRSALRDRSVGNYLRYKYDPDHQSWDPSREDVRDAPLVTEGKFPEKMSESANSKNGQGWPTVDLMEASKKYVETSGITTMAPR